MICKVLESIIRDHSITHLLKNELLSSQQHGFIKGRSTALQLLSMLDNWTEALKTGGQIDTIYSFTLTTIKLLTRFLIKDF